MKAFKDIRNELIALDSMRRQLGTKEGIILETFEYDYQTIIDPLTDDKYFLVEASLFEARKYPNWELISRLGNMNELGITITESIVNQRIAKGEPYIHRTYNSPFTDEERVKGFITKHLKSIYPDSKVEIERCGVQTLAVKINFNDQGAE